MKLENIELRIEELVLHGFAPGDRYRIGDAVERELARLCTEHGTPPSLAQGIEAERLDGGTFHVESGSRPAVVGGQIAQAIYGGLSIGAVVDRDGTGRGASR